MKKNTKKYRLFIILLLINIGLIIFYPKIGQDSIAITKKNVIEMLMIVPPIFILLGLLDVWVPKEIMIKYMGEKSGLRGVLLGFLLGSAAAGPLYAAFPVAKVLINKGSKLFNVLIFIGAWSTTKIPLMLFEASSMGWRFTLLRFSINLFGIAAIAYVTDRLLSKDEKELIYSKSFE